MEKEPVGRHIMGNSVGAREKGRIMTKQDVEKRLELKKADVKFCEDLLKDWPEEKVIEGSGWKAVQIITETKESMQLRLRTISKTDFSRLMSEQSKYGG
tara:strand:- start:44 stop:340 length:297 start_codon:yes stop_codon:yes gene_type:complete